MTPKELRADAEYFIDHPHCECDHEVGVYNCMGCGIDRMARHVLATVRDDDDEPVTQEFCDLHSDVFVPTMGGAYRVRRFRHVVIYNGELHIGNDSTGPVTVGRLRVILSALGIELKEPA